MFFLILIQRLKKSIITTYKIIHKYIIISNDSKYNNFIFLHLIINLNLIKNLIYLIFEEYK